MSGWELTPGACIRVLPKIEIEIRPREPARADSDWRVYAKPGDGRMLRKGRHLYGGSISQAHADAQLLEREMGFVYRPTPEILRLVRADERGLSASNLPVIEHP